METIKKYIQTRDPDFVILPSYSVFDEDGIKDHDVPEDVENPETTMQQIVRELAKDLLIEGKVLVGLEHGSRADWADLSLSVAF